MKKNLKDFLMVDLKIKDTNKKIQSSKFLDFLENNPTIIAIILLIIFFAILGWLGVDSAGLRTFMVF